MNAVLIPLSYSAFRLAYELSESVLDLELDPGARHYRRLVVAMGNSEVTVLAMIASAHQDVTSDTNARRRAAAQLRQGQAETKHLLHLMRSAVTAGMPPQALTLAEARAQETYALIGAILLTLRQARSRAA